MRSPLDTPCSQALETARNMKELAIFKKPNGVARRALIKKPKILDEETYIERMGKIIQRDFFPHLERLQAQNDYLDALEQNNAEKMKALYAKYSSGRPATERAASPATFETPLRETSTDLGSARSNLTTKSNKETDSGKVVKDEDRIGLDVYLSNHTSEDNASFEEIMIETEKRRRIKYAWLYEAEEKAKALEATKEALALEDNPKNSRPLALDGWSYKTKNFIMYVPDGVELTPEEQIDMAKRKQEVVHDNTRLTTNPFNERQNNETITELAKNQSKANDGKIGVDGKEVVRNPTPTVNGFGFVATTPSPRPGECDSPFMTWGQIEGTPFRLDGGDTPLFKTSQGPSFRMAEPPKREKIALQLAEKAGERHRDRKNKALEAARRSLASPSPRSHSTIDRLSTMSPAARRLATQKLKIVSNTPSPRRVPSKTPSIGIKTPTSSRITTPGGTLPNSHTGESSRSKGIVLTDNLLNLPLQRQRASDFFDK
ncbi:splicing factor ESS-2 homolog [Venturia canescens]|uniref:splicing factor ESS-2 homolog n=1 Tax=Venturia canescens TaxID=32260 RepID=UPI001C9C3EDE|nr:splicing factor ESS-2 homolog [Venturia canescens]